MDIWHTQSFATRIDFSEDLYATTFQRVTTAIVSSSDRVYIYIHQKRAKLMGTLIRLALENFITKFRSGAAIYHRREGKLWANRSDRGCI